MHDEVVRKPETSKQVCALQVGGDEGVGIARLHRRHTIEQRGAPHAR